MEAPVRDGATFETGPPRLLVEVPGVNAFDLSPDGNTIVAVTRDETIITHLNVVTGFFDDITSPE